MKFECMRCLDSWIYLTKENDVWIKNYCEHEVKG
jgi:hypothetical protein